MSYQQYKEAVQYALDRLQLNKKFEIYIFDTTTFLEMNNYIRAVNSEEANALMELKQIAEDGMIQNASLFP